MDVAWVGAVGSARLNKHADGLRECNASQSWNRVTMLTTVNADQYVCVVGWGFRLCSVMGRTADDHAGLGMMMRNDDGCSVCDWCALG